MPITLQPFSAFQQMTSTTVLLSLVLSIIAICGTQGQNATGAPSLGNLSSVTHASDHLTASSAVPTTQNITAVPTNATQETTIVPGINKGECYGFEVFVLNNKLNIPYTVTCCVTVLCGFYLVILGKINCTVLTIVYCKCLLYNKKWSTYFFLIMVEVQSVLVHAHNLAVFNCLPNKFIRA